MRYVLMSDIHGNLEALQAALEAARRYEPYQLMCLGDFVGYGADPEPCIELAGDKANLMLAGNHDLAVSGIISTDEFNSIARESIDWTRGKISAEDQELLANLPLQYIDGDYCYTHASPIDPMQVHVHSDARGRCGGVCHIGQRFCFVGHTHLPVLVAMNTRQGRMEVVRDSRIEIKNHRRYFVNVGSIGQPRDSNPDACMVVFDEEAGSLEFVRVPYDVSKSQGKILSNGLPSYLAERLVLAR